MRARTTPITARMIPTVHRIGMLAMNPMIIRTTPSKIILSPACASQKYDMSAIS